jgi:hypothetical protein
MRHDAYYGGSNALIVPGLKGGPNRAVAIDVVTRQILDEWVEFRETLNPGQLGPFFCTVSEGGIGQDVNPAYVREVVRSHVRKAGIRKRVSPEGLRKTFLEQSTENSRRIGLDIVAYVEDEPFRRRYPLAHAAWKLAVELYGRDAAKHTSALGLHCREAMGHFSEELCAVHGVEPRPESRPAEKVRQVIDAKGPQSVEVVRLLDASVALWLAVHDLLNRQVHGNEPQRRALTADDSLRVVAQTMLVMFEIDLAIGATS